MGTDNRQFRVPDGHGQQAVYSSGWARTTDSLEFRMGTDNRQFRVPDGHGPQTVYSSGWARTADSFPIIIFLRLHGKCILQFFLQHMIDALRHMLCKIRENYIPPFAQIASTLDPLHFYHEIPRFPKYEYILPNGRCVLAQQVYQLTNGLFESSNSNVRKNITSTHSFTQFLLSQIHPNCTIRFFLGTIYLCNGRCILTVVRARMFAQNMGRHPGLERGDCESDKWWRHLTSYIANP